MYENSASDTMLADDGSGRESALTVAILRIKRKIIDVMISNRLAVTSGNMLRTEQRKIRMLKETNLVLNIERKKI